MKTVRFSGICAALLLLALSGCSTPKETTNAFKQARPRSILVLPPVNQSNDIKATYGYYTTITQPLAEHGYYVYPIGIIDEFMKQNGLAEADEMHQVPIRKIREIIGADAVLYINLLEYGSSYVVINSSTEVHAYGRLVDARTGIELWSGSVRAIESSGGGGLIGAVVSAAVSQVINESSDRAHPLSAVANQQFRNPRMNFIEGPYLPVKEKSK